MTKSVNNLDKCTCGHKKFVEKLGGWVCEKCRKFYDCAIYVVKGK